VLKILNDKKRAKVGYFKIKEALGDKAVFAVDEVFCKKPPVLNTGVELKMKRKGLLIKIVRVPHFFGIR
jgi:hypothetical protein